MSNWTPISLNELHNEIEKGVDKMTPSQRKIWGQILIRPEKWNEVEYGQEGGGFWVVAIYGNKVIWYNDIEEGFNISHFSEYGRIDKYGCEQDELQWSIKKIKTHHNNGEHEEPL